MNTHAEKIQENKSQSAANQIAQKQNRSYSAVQLADSGPEAVAQRQRQEIINNSTEAVAQRKLQHVADSSLQTTQKKPLITQAKSSFSTGRPLKAVVQREILVGNNWEKHYDDTLVTTQYNQTKPFITQWKQMDEIFAAGTQKKTRDAKEKYVNDELENDIRAMLRKYNEKKSFDDDKDLTRQLVQDVKLKLLGMESIVGIDHRDGQFSEKADDVSVGRTGKSKTLRIYRTMSAEAWNTYVQSKDPKDVLRGHGGSLGQALHYFVKSKRDNLDDVLVEFEFSETAQNRVDYTNIARGGEGKEPRDGKLTGKKEGNDIMDLDEDIFSINLGKSKDLISQLNPKISLKDKVR